MHAAGSKTGVYRFSSVDISPQDRVAVLREVLCRVHLRADFETVGEVPPRYALQQFACGPTRLLFADADAFALARTAEFVKDGDGDFRFVFSADTPFEFASERATERMNAGEAMLVFNGATGTARYLESSRYSTMRIGHRHLLDVVPGLRLQPMWRLSPASWRTRLLLHYLEHLSQILPADDCALGECVGRHLIDLVALALSPGRDTAERTGSGATRAARLASIRADILANLSQMRLSAKTIARRHGVTDRYVHLLFEETGETFGRFVERERMKRALTLLTNSDKAAMRISDIAVAVGYAEHSTFNRAFRRCFGDTPRGVRRSRGSS
jgi:AraC-like DNA-binding protein